MSGEAEIRAALRAWVCETSAAPAGAISDHTALFGTGALESADVLELVLLIEELSERPLDIEGLRPRAFRCIDSLIEAFFQGEAHRVR